MTTRTRTPRRLATAGLLAASLTFAAVGCSSSGSSSKGSASTGDAATATTTAPTTTAAMTPEAKAAHFAENGPNPVGFTRAKLPDGRNVVVWYPSSKAAVKGHDKEKIDITGFLAPALQAKVPADDRVTYVVDAYEDAKLAPKDGGYPVVIFSHGMAGYPEQSVTITSHLASWGYVVAAPDHVERSLDGLLGEAAKGVEKSSDVDVISATLDWVEAQSKAPGLLHGSVDPSKAAVTGHSAGAGAAYRAASTDKRFKAFISYSVGTGGDNSGDTPPPAVPDIPGMVMAGSADGIIPVAASKSVFEKMHPPKYLMVVEGAGHLVFSDICEIGKEKGGIVALAKQLKLPIPDSLLRLGSDGCTSDFPPVTEAFPAIDSASVQFLDQVFDGPTEPDALTTAALTGLGTPVTMTKG